MADAWPFDVPLDVWARSLGDGTALVSVTGELDIATVGRLRVVLTPLSSDLRVRLLVCDLSGVSFFGCSGISALLAARATLTARGARLRVVATSNVVLRPLSVTKLLDALPVSPDVPTALA